MSPVLVVCDALNIPQQYTPFLLLMESTTAFRNFLLFSVAYLFPLYPPPALRFCLADSGPSLQVQCQLGLFVDENIIAHELYPCIPIFCLVI